MMRLTAGCAQYPAAAVRAPGTQLNGIYEIDEPHRHRAAWARSTAATTSRPATRSRSR